MLTHKKADRGIYRSGERNRTSRLIYNNKETITPLLLQLFTKKNYCFNIKSNKRGNKRDKLALYKKCYVYNLNIVIFWKNMRKNVAYGSHLLTCPPNPSHSKGTDP